MLPSHAHSVLRRVLGSGNVPLNGEEGGEAERAQALERRLPKRGPRQPRRAQRGLSSRALRHPGRVIWAWETRDQHSLTHCHCKHPPVALSGTTTQLAETTGL